MAPSDAELARMAGRLRVLTREQLRDAGLSRKELRTRLDHGRLQRLWWDVFVVGPADADSLSLAHAAALSYRGRAFVSHGWAAYVHGFGAEPRPPVDVVITGGSSRGRAEVLPHRSRTLAPHDLGDLDGIAVTSAARAILDCGDFATVSQVERLIADALLAKVVTPRTARGRPGPRRPSPGRRSAA
jgi:hypothetical protein